MVNIQILPRIMDLYSIRSIVRDEIANSRTSDYFARIIREISLSEDVKRAARAEASQTMTDRLPSLVSDAVRDEMSRQFPTFASNDPMIRSHLQNHLTEISGVCSRKIDGAAAELEKVGKVVAARMAKDDKFGEIYNAVVTEANNNANHRLEQIKQRFVTELRSELNKLHEERKKISDLQEDQQRSVANCKLVAGFSMFLSLGAVGACYLMSGAK